MIRSYLVSGDASPLPLPLIGRSENENPRHSSVKRGSVAALPRPTVLQPLTPGMTKARPVQAGNDSTFRQTVSPDGFHPKYLKDQAQVIDRIKKIDFLISSKSPSAIFSRMKVEDAKMKNEASEFYRAVPADTRQAKANFRLSRYLNS